MNQSKGRPFEEFIIAEEPYYIPLGDEVDLFASAYKARLPILLKGPTGCGKTRFVESMTYRLGIDLGISIPLITVACHEDLTGSDLVGRYLLKGEETIWVDGPLARAVKNGAICYLDEIVEARKDTTVLIHPLADYRRILPIEKRGEILEAHENFLLVISYNPGYQSVLKNLKHSTRQRFVAIEFHSPVKEVEARIIAHESGVDFDTAMDLAKLGEKVRNLRDQGLEEGVSTRLLIYAGQLIVQGINARRACEIAVAQAVADEPDVVKGIREVISAIFV
jgi:nitric oxide reductase NorQ protein